MINAPKHALHDMHCNMRKDPTHPPAFTSPTPPGQDLIYFSSANKETGLNVPDLKYGPTGQVMINSMADDGALTPRLG